MFANVQQPLEVAALGHESPNGVANQGVEPINIENVSNITPESIANGVPVDEKSSDDFRVAMGLIQCRTYLNRCVVLQSIINSIDRTPRAQRSDAEAETIVRSYYNRIRKFAFEAYQLAEARSSRGLLARSHYWCGRGCGGLRDWDAAMSHFTSAVNMDLSDVYIKSRPRQRTGLLKNEKEDVDFLLQSVTQRYNEWILNGGAHKAVDDRGASPSPTDILRKEALKGPRWRPHQEHLANLAEQQWSTERPSDKQLSQLRSSEHAGGSFKKEDMEAAEERLNLKDGKSGLRNTFNAEEWYYVLRGQRPTKKRTDRPEHNRASDRGRQNSRSSQMPPSVASTQSGSHSLLGPSHDLSNALDIAGYESGGVTPSLVGSGKSPSSEGERALPSPTAGYSQGRRNMKVLDINTSSIRKDTRLGKAVLGSLSPTGLGVDDTHDEDETGEVGSGNSMVTSAGRGLSSTY
ncbi:hypothetical protein J4E93_005287 [Alternaria ventricosa]|uniref:uncharacterized protein n=1 Tax=Alternaria ventricosa TaxID=1187951 RepID=UPI0020C203E4|nr:uncharacterized protein J4E93_005287 [Alternaria ventricosa]KAI4645709.1 hypothetical protein J4E93_005287 [Alternaria ventricosa]